MEKKKILSSSVTLASAEQVINQVGDLAHRRQSSYVCFANVHMLVESSFDAEFNEVLEQADIVAPDGLPVAVCMRLFHAAHQGKVSGPDLMVSIFEYAARENLSVFFYGSTPEVLEQLNQRLAKDFPTLRVAGMISPPFRALTPSEDTEMVEAINRSGANIVLVGLGCPKQERWMSSHKGKISAVMLGVGAAFCFYAGTVKRAPVWLQNIGLEWFYRMLQEPNRLFKRYFVTNSWFLFLFLCEYLKLTQLVRSALKQR